MYIEGTTGESTLCAAPTKKICPLCLLKLCLGNGKYD